MKNHLFVLLKSVGFFTLWGVLLFITNELDFIKESAFLRLWLEVLPLFFVIMTTLFFVKIIEKNTINMGLFDTIMKNGLLGLIFGICWIGIPIFLLFVFGTIKFSGINSIPYLWIWILSALINVIMQEYLVRGYLFSLIKKEYNILAATIITTLLFTLLHGGAFDAGIIAVINVITMSVFMSLLLVYTNTLIAPIMAHGIWNIVGSLMGYISLADDYPVLINSIIIGNQIITGGEYKLEGSVIILILNIINIIILIWLIKKKKKKIWGKSNCT